MGRETGFQAGAGAECYWRPDSEAEQTMAPNTSLKVAQFSCRRRQQRPETVVPVGLHFKKTIIQNFETKGKVLVTQM